MVKPVDCTHLVPPREKVPRWHCMIGDWFEGDCPIFLGKSKDCKYKNYEEETTMSNYEPKIKISKTANPKQGAWLFFGAPVLILILSLRFPFFQHVFTFGTFLLTVLMAFGCSAAYDDKKNDVKRIRPKPENRFNPPKWFKPAFFLIMIALSAGLRLGWYLVPICWIAIWIFLESISQHVKAGYPKEEAEDKS